MCGVAGAFGPGARRGAVEAMVEHLRHRGPDAQWVVGDDGGALGADRLSIIDLSPEGNEPLVSPSGIRLAFNGEIYNHVELRRELADYPFRTRTDTEVLLAAHERWGDGCLDRLIGMFAVLFWDEPARRLTAVRDRFGVKPLYYHHAADGTLLVASEIGALLAAGVPAVPDAQSWSSYLATGLHDHSSATFWSDIHAVPPGHVLRWEAGRVSVSPWYDLAAAAADEDLRPVDEVEAEYLGLLGESVQLRFRSDVPVGVNLSGGLDSALLLGLVGQLPADHPPVTAYTFATGDERYDELPWVRHMLAGTRHRSSVVTLSPEQVPALATSVQEVQDEPFGGLPTLAYAALFERARAEGTIVLLDGQGMDEQWAGYDYYDRAVDGGDAPLVQGLTDPPLRPECLTPEFSALGAHATLPTAFDDPLRRLQHRDLRFTKLPRALRFNDRASMRASTELREPFLDHRLVELALRQPADRKLRDGSHKWLLRKLAGGFLPSGLVTAPKRPLQTPQREWLRGPLRSWANELLELALTARGGHWLDPEAVRREWTSFVDGDGANSYFVWQWVSLGLAIEQRPAAFGVAA